MLGEDGLVAGFVHVLTAPSSTEAAKKSVVTSIKLLANRTGGAVLLGRQQDLLQCLGSLVSSSSSSSSSSSRLGGMCTDVQEAALSALNALASEPGNIQHIVQAPGVVTALLPLVGEGCAYAVGTLSCFTDMAYCSNVRMAHVPGLLSGVCEVVRVLDNGGIWCTQHVARAMEDLARVPSNRPLLWQQEQWLPCLVSMLASESEIVGAHAARALSYMAEDATSAQRIATMPEVIPRLMALLDGGRLSCPEVQEGAVRALHMLAYRVSSSLAGVRGLTEGLQAVINNSCSTPWAKESALTALVYLAGVTPAASALMTQLGRVAAWMEQLRSGSPDAQQQAAAALGSLAQQGPEAAQHIAEVPGTIDALLALVSSRNPQLQEAAMSALQHVAERAISSGAYLAQYPGLLDGLVYVMQDTHSTDAAQRHAVGTVMGLSFDPCNRRLLRRHPQLPDCLAALMGRSSSSSSSGGGGGGDGDGGSGGGGGSGGSSSGIHSSSVTTSSSIDLQLAATRNSRAPGVL
jgi:uncharacterized membrane protein YgcG